MLFPVEGETALWQLMKRWDSPLPLIPSIWGFRCLLQKPRGHTGDIPLTRRAIGLPTCQPLKDR